jgi:hypothetical protein
MARAALKMNVRELAAAAEVSPNTVTRIEADLPSNATTLAAIRRVLEAAGVEFIDHEKPGVRMARPPDRTPATSVSNKSTSAKKAKPAAKSRRPAKGSGKRQS